MGLCFAKDRLYLLAERECGGDNNGDDDEEEDGDTTALVRRRRILVLSLQGDILHSRSSRTQQSSRQCPRDLLLRRQAAGNLLLLHGERWHSLG